VSKVNKNDFFSFEKVKKLLDYELFLEQSYSKTGKKNLQKYFLRSCSGVEFLRLHKMSTQTKKKNFLSSFLELDWTTQTLKVSAKKVFLVMSTFCIGRLGQSPSLSKGIQKFTDSGERFIEEFMLYLLRNLYFKIFVSKRR